MTYMLYVDASCVSKVYLQSYMQMDNDKDRLKDLLESSLSQVEDYACSIRETSVQNLAPDNTK